MDSSTSSTGTRNGLLLLALVLLIGIAMSLMLGAVSIPFSEFLELFQTKAPDSHSLQILRLVRLPRTLAAVVCGAAFAVAGAIIQTILDNPLASPNIIGVNSGAGVAVVLASALLPLKAFTLPLAAFVGAFIGVFIVLAVTRRLGSSRITVILTGVAVSGMFGAVVDTVVTLDPDSLVGYSDFRIGGLQNLSMQRVVPGAIIIGLALVLVLLLAPNLDILALGSDVAHSLGLKVSQVRFVFLLLAAALAGSAVSIAGLLGFVGLLVPHMMRRLFGTESLKLLPACALGGAALLTLCDVLARLLFIPFELPVGIIMSLGGGTFFLYLLLRRKWQNP